MNGKCRNTKSEHSSGKGLRAWAVLTGLQDPNSFLELSKDTHVQTKHRQIVMARQGDWELSPPKVTGRHTWRGMQEEKT